MYDSYSVSLDLLLLLGRHSKTKDGDLRNSAYTNDGYDGDDKQKDAREQPETIHNGKNCNGMKIISIWLWVLYLLRN